MKQVLLRIIRISIVAIIIITTVLAILGSGTIGGILLISAIFTLSITTLSVSIVTLARPHIEHWAPALKTFILILAIILSAILGTMVGTIITSLIYPDLNFYNYIKLFIKLNIILALVIGGSSLIFYRVYRKYEQSMKLLHEEELNRLRLEQQKSIAELKAIQAQVNPHFLFNTLNSLAALIKVDKDKALDMVQTLSDFYRQVLTLSERTYITVEDEISLVRNYLQIEKIRFADRLKFEIFVQPELLPVNIPSMIIQPLVENAVKHSISPRIEGGNIRVSVHKVENYIEIVVFDDGPGFDPKEASKGHGIDLVHNKINLCYSDEASVRISSRKGTTIVIKIPGN